MLCPKCGKSVGESLKLCSACQMKELQEQGVGFGQSEPALLPPMTPAGFWLRFFASFADAALVALITLGIDLLLAHLLQGPLTQVIQNSLDSSIAGSADAQLSNGLIFTIFLAAVVAVLGLIIVNSFVWIGYHTIFEASPLGGSPGKIMTGLRVTGEDGSPITLVRAFFRNISKLLSSLTLGIGFLLAGFTRKKQALHDMLTGSVVNASLEMPTYIRVLGCIASVSLFLTWYIFIGNPKSLESLSKFPKSSPTKTSYSYSVSEKKSDRPIVITNENIGILSKQKGLAGEVRGQKFIPATVVFSSQVKTLTFRKGEDFFADQEITIFLFTELKDLPGKIFKIGRDTEGLYPHIHISSKIDGKRTPETKIFTDNYALYLRIHGISGNILSGEIKLLVPGAQGARLAGSFKASID